MNDVVPGNALVVTGLVVVSTACVDTLLVVGSKWVDVVCSSVMVGSTVVVGSSVVVGLTLVIITVVVGSSVVVITVVVGSSVVVITVYFIHSDV